MMNSYLQIFIGNLLVINVSNLEFSECFWSSSWTIIFLLNSKWCLLSSTLSSSQWSSNTTSNSIKSSSSQTNISIATSRNSRCLNWSLDWLSDKRSIATSTSSSLNHRCQKSHYYYGHILYKRSIIPFFNQSIVYSHYKILLDIS